MSKEVDAINQVFRGEDSFRDFCIKWIFTSLLLNPKSSNPNWKFIRQILRDESVDPYLYKFVKNTRDFSHGMN